MSHTAKQVELARIRSFIASHGNDTWIEGNAVHFVQHYSQRQPDGSVTWGKEIIMVNTASEARDALGY